MATPDASIPPLDIEQPEALAGYLRRTGRLGARERPVFRLLTGGVSNRVVWMGRSDGSAWVFKQALPKLRVAVDWFSSPDRVHREALGLRWLARLTPSGSVPRLIFEDEAEKLLAMEAVPSPHENWKSLLLQGRIESSLILQFGRLLGCIHRKSVAQAQELAGLFADRSFFESLRLEPYYQYAAEQMPAAASFLTELIRATRAARQTLVHGDYSPKNLLVWQERLVLLDHEVIHWGDPSFDLGFSLTHLLAKSLHLPSHRTAFARAAVDYWESYRAAAGVTLADPSLERRAVRQTLGCLLARVVGRSPLEYLNAQERMLQQTVALRLIESPPATVPGLVEAFEAGLGM